MYGHLIGFYAHEEPTIVFWKGEERTKENLIGKINILFYGPKRCVGYFDGHSYHKCPNNARYTSKCPTCRQRDFSKVRTHLDLSGFEEFREEVEEEEFILYLAYFRGIGFKVGVTQEEREEKRLREQGADAYVVITRGKAEDCYRLEKELQERFGFLNAVTRREKKKHLWDPLDKEKIKEEIEQISKGISIIGKCVFLEYPVPKEAEFINNEINGEVIGYKGSFLFFKNKEGNFGIDMKDEVGKTFSLKPI